MQAATKAVQQGKFAEAEKAFAKIAKDRKGTPWGETAQYYLAETQYQRGKYVDAHDSFEKLHADYPAPIISTSSSAASMPSPSSGRSKTTPRYPRTKLLPWYGRFDGRLPIIDTPGYALKALEHVRHNDPTGPLADDAALQIAEYYMKHHDYESAAMYYDQFIAEYPKSPFLQKVQHAAIDARLKAYLGPEYDASGLEKARELVQKTMKTFPEQQASYEGLYHTLDVINNAEAEKDLLDRHILQACRQDPSRRVLSGQDPPALARQPMGRQGQGRASVARQDAPNSVQAEQDHDPARIDGSVRKRAWAGWVAWAWAVWEWEAWAWAAWVAWVAWVE